MDSNCFIGELLYIGFLTEKNRCGSYRWPMGYKRVLKIHLSELKNIATLFNDSVNTEQVICHFRQVCKSEKTIGKYYEKIEWKVESVLL